MRPPPDPARGSRSAAAAGCSCSPRQAEPGSTDSRGVSRPDAVAIRVPADHEGVTLRVSPRTRLTRPPNGSHPRSIDGYRLSAAAPPLQLVKLCRDGDAER